MGFDPEKNIGPVKSMAKEPWDFSDRYNTKLTDEEERAYQQWAKDVGRERDVYNYDLRGAWREIMAGTMAEDERKHLGDKYKSRTIRPSQTRVSITALTAMSADRGTRWTARRGTEFPKATPIRRNSFAATSTTERKALFLLTNDRSV